MVRGLREKGGGMEATSGHVKLSVMRFEITNEGRFFFF